VRGDIQQKLDLILALTKREIATRYAGSVLGAFWSFINPLMLLAIYSLIFGVVFQAKWGGIAEGLTLDFSLMLFIGLIIFIFFSECVTRALQRNQTWLRKWFFHFQFCPW